MARLTGTQGSATVDTLAAGTPTVIEGVTNWTIDYVGSTAETTGMDDSGVKSFLPTTTEWSGSFEGHWDTGNPPYISGANDIMPGLAAGTVTLIATDGTTTVTCAGEAIYTGLGMTASYDGTFDFTFSFQGTGALTIT